MPAPTTVGSVIPVSAPPRVRSHLASAAEGPAPVLHHGPDAVYVDVAGRCVGVVGRRATRVPCALRTDRPRLRPVAVASVDSGVLHLDGEPLVIGRLMDVRVPRIPTTGRPGPGDLGQAEVARLVGAGGGLTPFGDDVLCGWLAVHRAAGVPTPEVDTAVVALAHRTTLLSATLLDCAMHGEVIPEFAAYLTALGSPAEPDRAAALAAVGHTSGTGLLQGARRALAALHVGAAA